MIATSELAKSPADGYTLMMTISSHVTNALLYQKITYKLKDFQPITIVATSPFVLIANPSSRRTTSSDDRGGQGQRNQLRLPGSGFDPTLSNELINAKAGVKMTHIPYRGGAPALTDLLADQVPMMFMTTVQSLPFLKDQRVKAIGVSTFKRTAVLPDVPTIAEAGVQGYASDVWFGIIAPAGTPDAVVDKLHNEIVRIVNLPAIKEELRRPGRRTRRQHARNSPPDRRRARQTGRRHPEHRHQGGVDPGRPTEETHAHHSIRLRLHRPRSARQPGTFSTRTVNAREYCLVRSAPATATRARLLLCREHVGPTAGGGGDRPLAPVLIGQESLRVEGLWREMYQEALLQGRAGAVMRALSALDIALWDLNARSVGLPLLPVLGANGRIGCRPTPAAAITGRARRRQLAEEMAAHVREGIQGREDQGRPRKPGGRGSADRRGARGHRSRRRLMLDANNAWHDLPTALELPRADSRRTDPTGSRSRSRPTTSTTSAAGAATRITVATGEIEAGRWRFKELIARGAADPAADRSHRLRRHQRMAPDRGDRR